MGNPNANPDSSSATDPNRPNDRRNQNRYPAEGQGPIQTAPKKQTSVALCQPFTPPSVEMTEN
jgi:hypothetical protein